MKKAALALGLVAASTSAAWAQSTVQLYGIMDVGLRYTSNANAGTSRKLVIPGGMSQSRLGINVTEDMGGGLKAIANLEHRLSSDTGAAASATDFWRQSWVGIQSADFGRITLGRQYNILFDIYTSTYASFKYSPYIEAYKPEIGLSLGARQDNMVKYLIESGPVRAEVQVSAGEGTGPNKSVGGLLRYADGPIAVGGAYLQVEDQLGLKVKAYTAGAAYTSGPWYLNLSWATNKFDRGGAMGTLFTAGLLGPILNASANDVKKRDMISAGATYQLTSQLNLGAHYWYATQTHYLAVNGGKGKSHYFAVVADYAFSKRTDAYIEMDYTKFSEGSVRFANGAEKRGGAIVGMRHRF